MQSSVISFAIRRCGKKTLQFCVEEKETNFIHILLFIREEREQKSHILSHNVIASIETKEKNYIIFTNYTPPHSKHCLRIPCHIFI
jgi:hypothetical protein